MIEMKETNELLNDVISKISEDNNFIIKGFLENKETLQDLMNKARTTAQEILQSWEKDDFDSRAEGKEDFLNSVVECIINPLKESCYNMTMHGPDSETEILVESLISKIQKIFEEEWENYINEE